MRYSKIIQTLGQNSDEKYKIFHSKLKAEGEGKFYGVRVPKLREIAKNILQDNPINFLDNIKFDSYEEKILYGLVLSKINCDFEQKLKYLTIFISQIDSWAVCDVIDFKVIKRDQVKLWRFLEKYFKSQREFELRFAIICSMRNFFDDQYIDQVLEIIESIESDFYYVNMAAAWALQVAFVKYKQKTYDLFEREKTSPEIINKAIQKIRESRRISVADKQKVLKYKQSKKNL